MKRRRYYIDRLRSIENTLPGYCTLKAGYAAPTSSVNEFNDVLLQARNHSPRVARKLEGIQTLQPEDSNHGFCHNIKATELDGRIKEALTRLDAAQISDDELRRSIKEKFRDSHWFVTKRTAIGSFLGVVIAMLALNVLSLKYALDNSALAAATRNAKKYESEARISSDAIFKMREALESNDQLARLDEQVEGLRARAHEVDLALDKIGQAGHGGVWNFIWNYSGARMPTNEHDTINNWRTYHDWMETIRRDAVARLDADNEAGN